MKAAQDTMSSIRRILTLAALLALGLVSAAGAAPANLAAMTADVHHLDDEWAHIAYQVTNKHEQLREIDVLAKEAATVVARYPGRAEPLLWQGIITSEEAGMAGVLEQLGLARNARTMLERAEAIDPRAANGGVLMSLGVLYYRVPGFPIGFGNDHKASDYLKRALAMDPDGLDTNYFYGDFLAKQGDYTVARTVLMHALAARRDPNRPVWDKGRRAEVQALFAKLNQRAAQ
jgi:tetratricopeptide (TPR) repeat protein